MKLNELLQVINYNNIIELIECEKKENGIVVYTRSKTKKGDLYTLLLFDKIKNKKVREIKAINNTLYITLGNYKIDF